MAKHKRLTPRDIDHDPENPRDPDFIFFPTGADIGSGMPSTVFKATRAFESSRGCTVARSQVDADAKRGKMIDFDYLQEWTPELWSACLEYLDRRDERLEINRNEYNALKRGQIPEGSQLKMF